MRILIGNVVYDFSVVQDEAMSDFAVDNNEFEIAVNFRSPEISLQRDLRLARNGSESLMIPLMADILQEFEVPEQAKGDMATHFKFYLERLSRRNNNNNIRRRGNIPVTVTLNVKVMSSERAAAIQSRMEAGRRENREAVVSSRAAEEVAVARPAKRSAVEALRREKVWSEEERECSICLEKVEVGHEVITMPCLHVYHKDCILRWLQRNHFCPFCRFKLPC